MKLSVNLLFAGLVLFMPFARLSAQPYYWYYYTIDDSEPTGTYTSLALDSLDHPHISYAKPFNSNTAKAGLRYAKFDGNDWQLTVVRPDEGLFTSLALDPAGQPHITHVDNSGDLKHAYYQNGTWQIETIDDYGEIIRTSSIKIDKKGYIHVSYYHRKHPSGDLALDVTYAFFDGQRWKVTVLDIPEENGKWNSIALDSFGRPHISYDAREKGNLRYVFYDNDSWKKEEIEETTGVIYQGWYNSIAVDAKDVVHISHLSSTTKQLKYARGNLGSWAVEVVDAAPFEGDFWTEGSFTSIAVDQNNNPFISYYDNKNRDLKLAYKKNGNWQIAIVDSVGDVGLFNSLQINRQGLPVISYHDATNASLRLAIASLTPPPDSDLDEIPDYIEKIVELDFEDADSDDDGLSDGEEDQNHNGVVEAGETNPKNPDTDSDGIPDGVELGRTTGIKPPPGMRGTDLSRFRGDADPSTQTNPSLGDTDGDGLNDGEEDKNVDGRVDFDEPDPNNPDTDADGLVDGGEVSRGTSPLDIDSDDDGLADNDEDKNLNGFLDDDETDPARADTDGDGLQDGLELGIAVPVADPDGSGKLQATKLPNFRPDADPTTTTNPLQMDTDSDGIKDGDEDKNLNGRLDVSETSPLNADTDGDGLRDGIEIRSKTDALDRDSDDDGVLDGDEDKNRNTLVDEGETSPWVFDSDDDGVSDGVELGVTSGISDPDRNGPLLGTESTLFKADSDPSINSNPLLWDTDGDGLSDGEEDTNANGAVNAGETHFLIADTDKDGVSDGDEISFKSNPLDPRSKKEIGTLFQDNFSLPGLNGWTVVDEGNIEAPSDWYVYNGALIQASNIWGGNDAPGTDDPHKPGTYIVPNQFTGSNYKITFKIRSTDDDELGIMFRYRDSKNYYRFSMNREKRYQRITKSVDGKASVIALQEFSYQQDRYYDIRVFVVDEKIQVYLDGHRIFGIQDSALKNGGIAFYCWKNAGALFKEVTITGQGNVVAVHDFIQEFALRNQFDGIVLSWKISYHPSVAGIELFKKDADKLSPLAFITPSGNRADKFIEGEYRDDSPWQAQSYRLVLYNSQNGILDEKTLLNADDQIRHFSLSPVYPNPASQISSVVFQTPQPVVANYKIFDVLGRVILISEETKYARGWHQILWDGRDNEGKLVPSGVYFMQVTVSRSNTPHIIAWTQIKKLIRFQGN